MAASKRRASAFSPALRHVNNQQDRQRLPLHPLCAASRFESAASSTESSSETQPITILNSIRNERLKNPLPRPIRHPHQIGKSKGKERSREGKEEGKEGRREGRREKRGERREEGEKNLIRILHMCSINDVTAAPQHNISQLKPLRPIIDRKGKQSRWR